MKKILLLVLALSISQSASAHAARPASKVCSLVLSSLAALCTTGCPGSASRQLQENPRITFNDSDEPQTAYQQGIAASLDSFVPALEKEGFGSLYLDYENLDLIDENAYFFDWNLARARTYERDLILAIEAAGAKVLTPENDPTPEKLIQLDQILHATQAMSRDKQSLSTTYVLQEGNEPSVKVSTTLAAEPIRIITITYTTDSNLLADMEIDTAVLFRDRWYGHDRWSETDSVLTTFSQAIPEIRIEGQGGLILQINNMFLTVDERTSVWLRFESATRSLDRQLDSVIIPADEIIRRARQ